MQHKCYFYLHHLIKAILMYVNSNFNGIGLDGLQTDSMRFVDIYCNLCNFYSSKC